MPIQDPFKLLYEKSMGGGQSTPAPNMSTPTGPVYAPPTTINKPKTNKPTTTTKNNISKSSSLTPEQIQKQGYTILTDPSQISQYDIAGQYGETNAPGSFLYGKKKLEKPNTPNTTPEPITKAPVPLPTPSTTPTTPSPTKTETQDKNIFDLYGIEGNEKPATNDMFSLYGVEQPTRKTPDTSQYDDMIDKFRPTGDKEKIQQMLDQQIADISSRYEIQRADTKRQTESEFQSQLSGLYNAGVVNPLSSGTGSIDAASDAILDRRMKAIQAQETAEKAIAIARAYEQETAAADKALEFAKEQRKRLETKVTEDYEYDRQQISDKIDMVNNVVSAWKSGQTVDRQKKLDAQAGVMDLISKFGSSAFDGMDENTIKEVEQATGYPEGSLFKGIAALKEKELVKPEEKMELRTIDGSLYNIYRDKNGAVKADLVIGKQAKGDGNKSSSNSKETGQSFEEWLAEKEQKDRMTYNIGDKRVLDDLMAEYQTTVGATEKKDTTEYKYETRNIGGETYQLKLEKKTGKLVETIPITVDGTEVTKVNTASPTTQTNSKYSF